jgi:hypothetical protein
MNTTRYDQGGSVLIIAVIAMLIFGILSFSFALLSRLEVTTGVNYKAQAQAEALAEAGLERGRDAVRTAADASGPCGFSRWTDPGNSSSYGCDAGLAKLLFSEIPLGAGEYSVVIDNDCFPLVPVAIEDAKCREGTPGRDENERAVLTAWATAANGLGRARVRAIVAIDTAWKHVCSNSSQDNPPGYCNEPANRNGNPTIIPADPNEYPGGPGAYDVLPTPALGCSEINPSLHANPGCSPSGRKVVTGGGTLQNCNGGGQTYHGYFDCALTTPCPETICGVLRPACVNNNDSRALTDSSNYKEAPCPSEATGMVFSGDTPFGNVGSSDTDGRNAYVMRDGNRGQVKIQGGTFYGTLVVEGNGPGSCGGSNPDMLLGSNGSMVTATTNSTHRVDGTTSGQPRTVYGNPLTLLIYDPQQPPPTAANPYAPQQTCADIGTSGSATATSGLIYSGGHVEFTSIVLEGGVVAFEIQTRGSTAYHYSYKYGKAAPPPGFPGNTVIPVRKSFIVCADYAADTGGGTACR